MTLKLPTRQTFGPSAATLHTDATASTRFLLNGEDIAQYFTFDAVTGIATADVQDFEHVLEGGDNTLRIEDDSFAPPTHAHFPYAPTQRSCEYILRKLPLRAAN